MKIEEAFAAVEKELRWAGRDRMIREDLKEPGDPTIGAEKTAVRAAMLAVLNEARSARAKPQPFVCADTSLACPGKPPCWVHELRWRIQELSR